MLSPLAFASEGLGNQACALRRELAYDRFMQTDPLGSLPGDPHEPARAQPQLQLGHKPAQNHTRAVPRRHQSGLVGWGLLALCLQTLSIGSSPARAEPVLHERIVVPQLRCKDATCRKEGQDSRALPDAVVASDGLIAAPTEGRQPEKNEQIYSTEAPMNLPLQSGAPPPGFDPPPGRRSRVLPDTATGPEAPGERIYHEVFNPAVFPYKRMTSVDGVGEDGALYQRHPELRPVQVEERPVQRGRDPFYGSVVVDFVAGKLVPIPTPAAGLRILSYKTTPAIPVRFAVDGADNLFAIAAQSGRYRLVYLVDAEPRYFAGALWPQGARKPRLSDVPPELVPELPRRIGHEAKAVLRHIGLRTDSSSDYAETLNRLVGYFRAFQLGELEEPEGRNGLLYRQLAMQQRGACRHRGYAFVITAHAVGIPARYVENELHVFVEVYIPLPGESKGYWRRINLGGAPLQQRIVEGEKKVAYQEKGGDPFERPPSFQSGTAPKVSGLPKRSPSAGGGGGDKGSDASGTLPALDGPEDRAKNHRPDHASSGNKSPADTGNKEPGTSPTGSSGNNGSKGSGKAGPGDGNGGAGSGGTSGSGTGEDSAISNEPIELDALPADEITHSVDERQSSGQEPLVSTHVSLSLSAARRIYRGMAIPVRGQVQAPRGSAAGLEVVLLLAIPGAAPRQLGRTFTGPSGSYQTEVEIPAGTPLGTYPLIARVRGDSTRRGCATSRY
jgi:transglutaminase-like putative cysteine protease